MLQVARVNNEQVEGGQIKPPHLVELCGVAMILKVLCKGYVT